MKKSLGRILTVTLGSLCAIVMLFAGIWALGERSMSFGINLTLEANAKCIIEMGTTRDNYVVVFNNSGSGTAVNNTYVNSSSIGTTININSVGIFADLHSGDKLYFKVTNKTVKADLSASTDIRTPALNFIASAQSTTGPLFASTIYSQNTDPVNGIQNIINNTSKEMSLTVQVAQSGNIQINALASVIQQCDYQVGVQVSGATCSNTNDYVNHNLAVVGDTPAFNAPNYTAIFTANDGLIAPAGFEITSGTTRLVEGTNYTCTYNDDKTQTTLEIFAASITGHIAITGEAKPATVSATFEFRNNDVVATTNEATPQTIDISTPLQIATHTDYTVKLEETSASYTAVCPEVLVWKEGIGQKQWVSMNSEYYTYNSTTKVLTIKAKAITDKILIKATAVNIWTPMTVSGGDGATDATAIIIPVAFAGGDGTEENPYQIATAEQLEILAYLCNVEDNTYFKIGGADATAVKNNTYRTAYYILTNNILLNDISNFANWATTAPARSWTPIGTFTGSFDGNGFVVSGMYISVEENTTSLGLFKSLKGKIENLGVIQSYIKSTKGVNSYPSGFICGDATSDNAVLKNNYATGFLNSYYAGMIIGGVDGYKVLIANCYSNGYSVATQVYTAGIIGYAYGNTNLLESFSYSLIVSLVSNVGGITAACGQDSLEKSFISNCINYGTVIGSSSLASGLTGVVKVGSIVDSSINYGITVNASANAIGGVTSSASEGSTINNSYNYGKILAQNAYGVCANVSAATANIENCYSVGEFLPMFSGDAAGSTSNCSTLNPTKLTTNNQVEVEGITFEAGSNLIDLLNKYSITNNLMQWVQNSNNLPTLSGNFADYFAGGDGTASNPYQVSTMEQLQSINYALDKHYVMTNDIDLNPGITFTFDADTGLVNIKDSEDKIRLVMGTGFLGDTSGSNTTYDTGTALTAGTIYNPTLDASGKVSSAVAITGTDSLMPTINLTQTTYSFSQTVNGAAQAVTITLNNWNPIGNSISKFTGTFDGQNHTVRAMYINTTLKIQGLFGHANGAVIQNVRTNEGGIKISSESGNICGRIINSTVINNCVNENVFVSYSQTAGIIGVVSYDSIVVNSMNKGTIISTRVGGDAIVAGIGGNITAGSLEIKSRLFNNYNVGHILNKGYNTGGIAGCNGSGRYDDDISNNMNIGTVLAQTAGHIGAIGGYGCDGSNNHYITHTTYTNNTVQNTSSSSTGDARTGSTPYTNTAWTNDALAPAANVLPNVSIADKDAMLAALNAYVDANPTVTVNGVVYQLSKWDRDRSDLVDGPNNGADSFNRGFPYLVSLFGKRPTTIASDYSSGTGTSASPYLIRTSSELEFLAAQVNAGNSYANTYFKLDNDITDGNIYTPIGNATHPFQGTFDGNGHTISNLNIGDASATDQLINNKSYLGLFGNVTNAYIHDLTLKNINVVGSNHIGALVGYAKSSTIQNIKVLGANVIKGTHNVGGIVGTADGGSVIENVYSNVTITTYINNQEAQNIGGIIGEIANNGNKVAFHNGIFVGEITNLSEGLNIGIIVGKIATINASKLALDTVITKVGYLTYNYCGNQDITSYNAYTTNSTANMATELNKYIQSSGNQNIHYWNITGSLAPEFLDYYTWQGTANVEWFVKNTAATNPSYYAGYTSAAGTSEAFPYIIKTAEDFAGIAALTNSATFYDSKYNIITTKTQGSDVATEINTFADQYIKLADDIDLNTGITMSFDADTGLVYIKDNENVIRLVMGTGFLGDTSGSNTVFDTGTAKTAGTIYNPTLDASGNVTAVTGLTATNTTIITTDAITKTRYAFAQSVNSATENITITLNQWTSIGNETNVFSGTFDGQNHTVRAMYINATSSNKGLFGYANGAVIQNIKTDGGFIIAVQRVGICGSGENSIFYNCINYNLHEATTNSAGGITGEINNVNVINCLNFGSVFAIHSNDSYAGGIIGNSRRGSNNLINNINMGNIYTKAGYNNGVVNYNEGILILKNNLSICRSILAPSASHVGGCYSLSSRQDITNYCVLNTIYKGTEEIVGSTNATAYPNTATTPATDLPNISNANKDAMLNSLNAYVDANPTVTVNGATYTLNHWARDMNDTTVGNLATSGADAYNRGFPYLADPADELDYTVGSYGATGPFASSSARYKYYLQVGEYPQQVVSELTTTVDGVNFSKQKALADALNLSVFNVNSASSTSTKVGADTTPTNNAIGATVTLPSGTYDLDGDGVDNYTGPLTLTQIKNYTQKITGGDKYIYWYQTTVNGQTYKFANTYQVAYIEASTVVSPEENISGYNGYLSDGSIMYDNTSTDRQETRGWYYVQPITYIVLSGKATGGVEKFGHDVKFKYDETNGFWYDENGNSTYDPATESTPAEEKLTDLLLYNEIVIDVNPYDYQPDSVINDTERIGGNYNRYTNNWDAAKDSANTWFPQSTLKTFLNDTNSNNNNFAVNSGLAKAFGSQIKPQVLGTYWLNDYQAGGTFVPANYVKIANAVGVNTYANTSFMFPLAWDYTSSYPNTYNINNYFTFNDGNQASTGANDIRKALPSDYAIAHRVVNHSYYTIDSSVTTISKAGKKSAYYWLRSGYPSYSYYSYYVLNGGTVNYNNVHNTNYGVRPAFQLHV